MAAISCPDAAHYWTAPLFPGGTLLTATFRNQRFCRHWHETYVIPVMQAGAQAYWYRGAQHVAPAGTIAAINPGEVHDGERAAPQGWTYRAFYPTVAWLERLAATIGSGPATTPWFPDTPIRDVGLACQLASAHACLERGLDPLEAETTLQSAFVSLLVRHAGTRPRLATGLRDDARVGEMQERLRHDLTEPMTLTALASSVGLSPFHAARLFTRAVGMPPHAWRNLRRIECALQRLGNGASAADAAAAAGFFDQSHFTRHVRRVYGVPPATLAKSILTTRGRKNIQASDRLHP
jgi:AraC-like DNA-binding protein